MIKFEHTEVMGLEAAIRGMRNPMNSWERSDSGVCQDFKCGKWGENDKRPICPFSDPYRDGNCGCFSDFIIGPNDHDLMMRLVNGGPVHAKFRRMIAVYVDITAPLYWWKEFDTYKVGTVANSCSTMHKIADKEFTLEDFSTEHLYSDELDFFKEIVDHLNGCRNLYLESKKGESARIQKNDWWQMIQLLPSSYNQKRTVMLNYEVLARIWNDRRTHKLDEWCEHPTIITKLDIQSVGLTKDGLGVRGPIETKQECFGFCDWIKTLPYSELIAGPKKKGTETCMNCFQPKPSDEEMKKSKEISQTIWDLTQILMGKADVLSKYPGSVIEEVLKNMESEKNGGGKKTND